MRDATGKPAIADDTALEVSALGGRPGVRTARYVGPSADPAKNVALLLTELAGVKERAARFRTVAVASLVDGSELSAEGTLEGEIATVSRRSGVRIRPRLRPARRRRSDTRRARLEREARDLAPRSSVAKPRGEAFGRRRR